MIKALKMLVLLLAIAVVLSIIVWTSYFVHTRNGFRSGSLLMDVIVETGNQMRNRNANANIRGKLYPEMTDQEFGSRIVHSICASGAPCIAKERYRLKVWSRTPDYESAGVSFGDNLGARWSKAYEPGDRYVCHMFNPYWFTCLAGSFRRTEYRFIPDGPYTPITMWEGDGANRAR